MNNVRSLLRDPRLTEFSNNEIIINSKTGVLFYKSILGLHSFDPLTEVKVLTEDNTLVSPSTLAITSSIFSTEVASPTLSLTNTPIQPTNTSSIHVGNTIGGPNSRYAGSDQASTNPTRGSALTIHTNNGFVDIGCMNTYWCHFFTDNGGFYFSDQITVGDGKVTSYNNLSLQLLSGTSAAVDRGRIEIKNSIAETVIHGDLEIATNTSAASSGTAAVAGGGSINCDGDITSGGDIFANGGFLINSPNGTTWELTVDDNGNVSAQVPTNPNDNQA